MSIIHKLRVIFKKKAKLQLLVLLFGIIGGALLETLALSLISPFISVLIDSSSVNDGSAVALIFGLLGFRSHMGFLVFLAFALAFVYISRGVYLYFLNKIQYKLLASQMVLLSDMLLTIILNKPYMFHSGKNPADLFRVVISDVTSLFIMITSALSLLADLFMTIFMLVFLIVVSPPMTLVILVLSSICVFSYLYFFRRKIRDAGEENRSQEIVMYKAVNQALGGIKELKILRREPHFIGEFRKGSEGFVGSHQRYQVYVSLPRLFIESVCFGGAFMLIGTLIGLGMDMESLVPQISVFVLAAFRMLPAVSRLTGYISSILYNRAAVDSIYLYISEKDGPKAEIKTPHPKRERSKDIVVENVTFQYPGTNAPVLDKVSLRIPHMRSVAFVGASGAGKTTLADIILGIYKPADGTVYYDGYDVHENPAEWVKNVGYIPQQIYLLDDTVLNNIAFGLPAEQIDREKAWRALEQAQLKDFVASLPDGLDTFVGDRGVRLSGGQRQRVGIARALYENPPILVLDEATSSLDMETEAAVMDAVNSLQGTKTMLIIAHRLSTIERCDVVYKIHDGKASRQDLT